MHGSAVTPTRPLVELANLAMLFASRLGKLGVLQRNYCLRPFDLARIVCMHFEIRLEDAGSKNENDASVPLVHKR
jgi:hypothetical protein